MVAGTLFIDTKQSYKPVNQAVVVVETTNAGEVKLLSTVSNIVDLLGKVINKGLDGNGTLASSKGSFGFDKRTTRISERPDHFLFTKNIVVALEYIIDAIQDSLGSGFHLINGAACFTGNLFKIDLFLEPINDGLLSLIKVHDANLSIRKDVTRSGCLADTTCAVISKFSNGLINDSLCGTDGLTR